MSLQADFMAGVVKDGPNNLGMLIMPQWTYHKGQLALLEQQALQMITERRISADNKFALPFAEASVTDQRDGRPLFYDGRVLVPANLKKDRYLWKDAPLLKGRVETAKQLAGKDMVQVVDVSDTALPSSTDLEGTIRGAARWSQLGTDAYLKLLDAALLGLPPNTRTGILVVSLTVGVGHCFQAWVQKRASLSVPFYYMGVCEDGLHVEWLMREETQRLKVQHLEGTLKVPGCAPPHQRDPAGPPGGRAQATGDGQVGFGCQQPGQTNNQRAEDLGAGMGFPQAPWRRLHQMAGGVHVAARGPHCGIPNPTRANNNTNQAGSAGGQHQQAQRKRPE